MARKSKQRSKGLGTLERKGRVWRARWTVDGKTYTKTTGTSDRREAEKILAEIVAPFAAKSDAERLENLAVKIEGRKAEIRRYEDSKPALALADGFEAYAKSGARPDSGARTMADYEGYFNGLVEWLKANRAEYSELRQVTREDAEAFAADYKSNHSAGSFNKRIVFFRCMWRTLAESETARLVCNPWEKIAKLRNGEASTRRELTIDELRRVCGSAEGELRRLLAVGIYTGLRLGDCALLEWGNVDMVRGIISVIPRKTARHAHGKPVVIPIHSALAAVLAETPPAGRMGYVMPDMANAYGREPSIVTNRIQKHFVKCGIQTRIEQGEGRKALTAVGFHSLRHTFVSLSANAGAPLAVVQAIVGHSNPAMTRHYFHESETALQSAVCALPSISLDCAESAENAPCALPAPVKADEPADGADAAQSRFSAFCDIVRGMTAEELHHARAEIDRLLEMAQA